MTILWLISFLGAAPPTDTAWLVWTSRVEGATVNVEEAARKLAKTADEMNLSLIHI